MAHGAGARESECASACEREREVADRMRVLARRWLSERPYRAHVKVDIEGDLKLHKDVANQDGPKALVCT